MLSWMKKNKDQKNKTLIVNSPINGRAVSLEEVPDPAFSEKMMGNGIAIVPSEGKVYAPFAGTVAHLVKSKHAIVLIHESGAQVLIHIGVDTVSLKGEGFTAHVENGDRIEAGQLLLEFDIEHIVSAGLPVITSVIVPTGTEGVKDVTEHVGDRSSINTPVLTLQLIS
ncbi:PTS glucose transporter subunit IIA [Paenibacillus peoriae]|uniref:PTS sugar transporter subunit IIA n=1 Tax=Paenibacillus peoriae TaxID=59893 RepID=UPI00026C6153|nr:PTS glucose transporter subunit IIA [Paenibacillus peoriae]MEC0184819.1 PTS glucose transporter subunit IIA [Paenibacillus peoriae]